MVSRGLIVDNLTPVGTRTDRYTPGLGRFSLDYAQYHGFLVDPAVPPAPTARTESQARHPYVRRDCFCDKLRDLLDP